MCEYCFTNELGTGSKRISSIDIFTRTGKKKNADMYIKKDILTTELILCIPADDLPGLSDKETIAFINNCPMCGAPLEPRIRLEEIIHSINGEEQKNGK